MSESKDLTGRTVSGATYTALAQGARHVVSLGTTAALARLLTPAEFGRYDGEHYYETMWNTNAIGTKNLLMAHREHTPYSSANAWSDGPLVCARLTSWT